LHHINQFISFYLQQTVVCITSKIRKNRRRAEIPAGRELHFSTARPLALGKAEEFFHFNASFL
jgi:hypothetical protein